MPARKYTTHPHLRSKRLFRRIMDPSEACVYCGFPSTCRDHFLPWSKYEESATLDCCEKCNVLLHASEQRTFGERCRHLAHKYRDRYRLTIQADFASIIDGTCGGLRRELICDWITQLALTEKLERLDYLGHRGDTITLSLLATDNQREIDKFGRLLGSVPEFVVELPDSPDLEFGRLATKWEDEQIRYGAAQETWTQ